MEYKYFNDKLIISNNVCSNLEKENNDGHIEYKWKLINIEEIKIEKIITQMKYRLFQGNGNAEYYIGVRDNGDAVGISEHDINETLLNILFSIERLKCNISQLKIMNSNTNKKLYVAHLKISSVNKISLTVKDVSKIYN